jgi:acetylornithine/N-succinyldiaminopimelate aminotransferase
MAAEAMMAPESGGTPELQERWRAALMDNYGTPSMSLVRGQGARVWDAEGREYVDLLGGIAVNALGHAHPDVVAAVSLQMSTLGHTSNLAISPPAVALAERLIALLDPSGERGGRAFFCNSGAEANEAALKLTRRTGRTRVVVAERSFHGRTMGALALTAQPAKQDPFRPLPGDVVVVPFGDVSALRAAVDDTTAAVFLEPIQGEGGVIPAPEGYLAAAREACDAHGALLVLDEVQTGIGRTGDWFAHQADGVLPDVVTLAKGLGGGLPIGACIAFGPAADLLGPGSHGSTFGGNPVSCAAALAVLDVIEREHLVARARVAGGHLSGIVGGATCVSHVRGRGLLLGAVLGTPVAAELEASARAHGLIVNAVAPYVIRMAPPLILTDEDLDRVAELWPLAIKDLA